MLSLNGKYRQPRPQDKFGLRGLHQVLVDCHSTSENGIDFATRLMRCSLVPNQWACLLAAMLMSEIILVLSCHGIKTLHRCRRGWKLKRVVHSLGLLSEMTTSAT
jgi:hypothetical protein